MVEMSDATSSMLVVPFSDERASWSTLTAFRARVSVTERMFATISSMADEDWLTLPACVSIRPFSRVMFWTIWAMVASVSVTLADWLTVFCFIPSMLAWISLSALAVSSICVASVSPFCRRVTVVFRIEPTMAPIFPMVWLKKWASWPISSFDFSDSRRVRSPSPEAMFSSANTALRNGRDIARYIAVTSTVVRTAIRHRIRILAKRSASARFANFFTFDRRCSAR